MRHDETDREWFGGDDQLAAAAVIAVDNAGCSTSEGTRPAATSACAVFAHDR
jgi:hypothetical protein